MIFDNSEALKLGYILAMLFMILMHFWFSPFLTFPSSIWFAQFYCNHFTLELIRWLFLLFFSVKHEKFKKQLKNFQVFVFEKSVFFKNLWWWRTKKNSFHRGLSENSKRPIALMNKTYLKAVSGENARMEVKVFLSSLLSCFLRRRQVRREDLKHMFASLYILVGSSGCMISEIKYLKRATLKIFLSDSSSFSSPHAFKDDDFTGRIWLNCCYRWGAFFLAYALTLTLQSSHIFQVQAVMLSKNIFITFLLFAIEPRVVQFSRRLNRPS